MRFRWLIGALAAVMLAGAVGPSPAATRKSKPAAEKVNLNTASQAELEALPGVGAATAQKIIAGRPYSSSNQLSKLDIPPATLAKFKSKVTAAGGGSSAGTSSGSSGGWGAMGKAKASQAPAASSSKPAANGGWGAMGKAKSSQAPASTPTTSSTTTSKKKDSWFDRMMHGKSAGTSTSGRSAPSTPEPGTQEERPYEAPPYHGMVWVNTDSKIYHYEGDRWYGKTKEGKYMTEQDALREGFRASKQKISTK